METLTLQCVENWQRIRALARVLDLSPADAIDIEQSGHDETTLEHGREEWLVLTDEEADEKAREDIEQSLWAFNASFLCGFLRLPSEAEEMIRVFQEKRCEDANDTIRALVGDRLDDLVEQAIRADGRGHFLARYDSEEREQGQFFLYRVN